MRGYVIPANINATAAKATMDGPVVQANIFSKNMTGGAAALTVTQVAAADTPAQNLVNNLGEKMATTLGQGAYDQRVTGGKRKKYKTIRRKKRTHRKKHNKRITRRRNYTKW
jgi:hypothetical protein